MGYMTGELHAVRRFEGERTADGKLWLKSYVDSGAARSVCSRKFGEHFGIVPTAGSHRGDGFLTATGKKVVCLGGRRVAGENEQGKTISMNYAVTDINVALDSVSQI